MIVRGFWENGRAYFSAVVTLQSRSARIMYLQADTAASNTIIAESTFPEGMVGALGIESKPVATLQGRMPAYVIPGCRITLFDLDDNDHTIRDLPLWFIREKLTWCERLRFRRRFGTSFGKHIRIPRNLLGCDVLNRYLFVAREPDVVLLTDEFDRLGALR